MCFCELTGCEAFLSDLDKLPFIQLGEFKLRLELDDDLTPELIETAERELRETPEQQEKSMAELRAILESTDKFYVSKSVCNKIFFNGPKSRNVRITQLLLSVQLY